MPSGRAQTNYVRNPSFERYDTCPYNGDQLTFATYWRGVIDSNYWGIGEYFNACANTSLDHYTHVPDNTSFYQKAHFGNGVIGGHYYYDKTSPAPPNPPLPFDYRDYAQVRLYETLNAGKSYCVTFYINLAEASGYAHNKIGAYLDDGSVNSLPLATGSEITSVMPQVYTNSVVSDTMNWTKIEGTFTATGNEIYISLGNFAKNGVVTAISTGSLGFKQYSYYLFDDVSVVESDLPAVAGPDTWVEVGKTVKVGRVGDTTAEALDCKWYHQGSLIDSGAIISVTANATVGATDTYIVVQTVCGLSKNDTVLVRTVPLGIQEWDMNHSITIFPNPTHGSIHIQSISDLQSVRAFDLSGRVVIQQPALKGNSTSLDLPAGLYIVEVQTTAGATERKRVMVD
ncbi:hypothetical protein GCM10023092_22840 [Rurimicrobium arvi]|uniref:Secretion system C-terminal sorting domain-containing protein n=1 Tax=Rurimicrobium arvi TaxID=2049916 RepID=A0ABP8MVP0_9BACT